MCAKHRTDVLDAIRKRLSPDNPQPCRVVSTQLVEAGVDIDFPVVYRAMTGIDSIAQSAGRCNREGRLKTGKVYVFETDVDPRGDLRRRRQVGTEVAGLHEDLLGLEAVERYFSLLYWTQKDEWDRPRDETKKPIMQCFSLNKNGLYAQFRDVAEAYKLIDDAQQSIVVPYGPKGQALIDDLRSMSDPHGGELYSLARRAQRYSVGVYSWQLERLQKNAQISLYHERFWVLENPAAYDNQLGLRTGETVTDPSHFVL